MNFPFFRILTKDIILGKSEKEPSFMDLNDLQLMIDSEKQKICSILEIINIISSSIQGYKSLKIVNGLSIHYYIVTSF